MKIRTCPNTVRVLEWRLVPTSARVITGSPRSAAGLSRLTTASLVMGAVALAAMSVFALPATVLAQDAEADIVAVVDAYHAALASGDSITALGLLADDVVILESGGMEDKTHYRSGHLAGDMRFARAVPADRGEMRVQRVGDVAWTWSTSTRTGSIGDREIDSQGAELMVLERVDGRWLIKAIHWSSRSRS